MIKYTVLFTANEVEQFANNVEETSGMALQHVPAGILAVLKELKSQEETTVDQLAHAFKNSSDSRELIMLHNDVKKLRKTKQELLAKLRDFRSMEDNN